MSVSKQSGRLVASAHVGLCEGYGIGCDGRHEVALAHLVTDLRDPVRTDGGVGALALDDTQCARLHRASRRATPRTPLATIAGLFDIDVEVARHHLSGLCECSHTEFVVGSRRGGRR